MPKHFMDASPRVPAHEGYFVIKPIVPATSFFVIKQEDVMQVITRNLHLSPDGIYRKCVAVERACPYGIRAEQHVSVVDLAHSGGAVIAEGHGHREVGPIIEEGFWIKAEVRRRGFHEDGRPMKGSVFTRWLKRALTALGRDK